MSQRMNFSSFERVGRDRSDLSNMLVHWVTPTLKRGEFIGLNIKIKYISTQRERVGQGQPDFSNIFFLVICIQIGQAERERCSGKTSIFLPQSLLIPWRGKSL